MGSNPPSRGVGRADVFIAGLGRAGTTLLCNLMTRPPSRWMMIEPGITRGDMGEHVRLQAGRLGLEITTEEWNAVSGESSLDRFQRVLLPRLSQLERWGMKEVSPAGWPELIAAVTPHKVVLMVRDLTDAGISVLEKESRNPGVKKSEDWLFQRLDSAAKAIVQLHRQYAGSAIIVRYEDLVSSAAYRENLQQTLDWPLDGDPGSNLDLFGRSYEKERHSGVVTDRSVGRHQREARAEWKAFAQKLRQSNPEFAEAFGYPAAPAA